MIYRIEVRRNVDYNKKFEGCFFGGAADMGDLKALPSRFCRSDNGKSARPVFWFTEKGWDKYGRRAIESLVKGEGQPDLTHIRVIKQKNPNKSRIVWQDKYQMYLLPESKKRK